MNLFCFTLDGSTESIYEPAYSQTHKDVIPKYQCSPVLLRRKPEWGGSDPSINLDRPQSTKARRDHRRSCLPTSAFDEKSDGDINHACWMLSGDRDVCKHLTGNQSSPLRNIRVKQLNSDRRQTQTQTQTRLPAQDGEAAADAAESIHATGRIKKLQNLMQTKKGAQSGAGKVKSPSEDEDHLLSNNNPVLTCIGLGKTAKQQQQTKDECSEQDGVCSPRLGSYLWSPFECPQPWTPFYHTCHQPRHELCVCGGNSSQPRRTEWDRFESLIQELDSKQSDPPQTTCPITDLQLTQNTLNRFGRFDAFTRPSMKPADNGGSLQKPEQNLTKLKLQRKEMETSSHRDRKHIKAASPSSFALVHYASSGIRQRGGKGGNPQRDEAEKREVGGGGSFSIGHRRSSVSLDSLYSLNSGQSSSSGVTSGSDYSSNRGSLRLEDDLLYAGQFCGRARVHTDFVPSPYDTESLKLKVGDVIDIILKPPMGIWTGVLNGRMGNFKFIYVDVLTEESPDTHGETQIHRERQKSTVQEVLRHLSLEEYSSSLQLNGYQTVDDLMRLREQHLTDLNVTDPEHRHRLLAAVDSLQQLRPDRQLENEANQEAETPGENMKADTNNCPRDSGCHMPSDSPDNSAEDTHLHFISEYPLTAETTAS